MYLSGETSIFGIIGDPVTHSFSPAMQTIAFQHYNYNAVYIPLAIKKENLHQVIKGLEIFNISGINVTAPFKKDIIPYLDEISEEARNLQSVNTIYRSQDKWIGCSTDGDGFVKSLTEKDYLLECKTVQIVGCGGAARAIIYALAKSKVAKIYISNRTYSKVLSLINDYSKLFPKTEFIVGSCEFKIDILVNTTSIGSDFTSMSVQVETIERSKIVVDIIYHTETPLIKKAEQLGKIVLGGMPMLLYQGALSFEIWTKQQAPIKVMRDCLLKLLEK